ncbi:uncharacterized protein LOC143912434 isoform X2 [Arctopsyche grandis]|uniref:uncharacterized protein LOC143912434 isoform X2 n=1 Tax=Arctopsyche grandis TaxID=121162 RepID=UPI00406D7A59
MFSVLSRLAKPGDGKKFNTPAPMSTSLQKKFARGVDYNMKILIKGDRNVGKSCLLQRLQGGSFIEEYHPTDQIQVAPIHWKYKDTEHIIKVEVWEVVDKGRVKKKGPAGLKFDNSLVSSAMDAIETPALDATFLDVYVNANGVIMMMDITKTWTFEYIKREIESVPTDLPIIILGNHCDMHHHREVDSYQIEIFMMNVRQTRSGPLRYAESSMRNGFGLRLLHTFFNIPFLKLQRQTLLNQLTVNDQEIQDAHKELDEFEKSEGADYNVFLDRLASKRNASDVSTGLHIATDKSPSIVLGAGKPIIPPNLNPLAQANLLNQHKSSLEQRQSLKSNINTMSVNKIEKTVKNPEVSTQSIQSNMKSIHLTSIDVLNKPKNDLEDFCAGVLDHSFLDDYSPTGKSNVAVPPSNNIFNKQNIDSESDGDIGANPLVVGIQDDVDTDEDDDDDKKSMRVQASSVAKIKLKPNENFNGGAEQQFPRPVSKFTPYNETIINGIQSTNYLEGVRGSGEMETLNAFHAYNNRDADDDQYDSGPDFSQPPGYDSMPSWSLDVSVRRSPEGGEGVSPSSEGKKQNKSKEEKKHKKSKKSSKDNEKTSKKDKDKDKEKKSKEKKHKKKGSDEYLEEFLGGGVKVDSTEGIHI